MQHCLVFLAQLVTICCTVELFFFFSVYTYTYGCVALLDLSIHMGCLSCLFLPAFVGAVVP